ncbi:MAG: chromosome segregation protein SMC [Proteocatella sp.]
MRLKSIELKGFKSFYHKTKIEFPNGIISIVGPNGSGKSNILDAFRWVLGEQSAKNLRGERMEDVIFSGTKLHNQTNYCEIEILFENEDQILNIDFSEVSIKRKAYRSGESSYYLNGKQCRLREIKELLMDSGIGKEGYSIISQGKIDEIVNATSVQRRKILEEASGIAKFRFKKEESEKKLDNTKNNMERLNDIFTEIQRQVEPLKKQSEKASKYLNLKEELKVSEINNLLIEYDEVYKTYSEDKASYNRTVGELESIEKELSESKEHIEKYDEIKKHNLELTSELEINKNRLNLEKNNIENEIARNGEKIVSKKNQIEKVKNIINSIDSNMLQIETELTGIESENLGILRKIEKIKNEISEIELKKSQGKHELDTTDEKFESMLENKRKLVDEKNRNELRIQFISENLEFENKRKIENKMAMHQLEKNIEEIEFKAAIINDKLKKCKHEIEVQKLSEQELNSKILEFKSLQEKSEKEIENMMLQKRDVELKQNLYMSMEKDMEGINKSVKTVLENRHLNGIVDIVVNIIKTDKKYEKAIETALGGSLQHVVTRDSQAAKNAVEFLKRTKSGRATFLPMDTIKSSKIDIPGVTTASSIVDSRPEYKNIVDSLLGRTIIVENIEEAILLSKKLNYKYRIVTLEGEIFNQGGSITGGHYYKQSNILGRKRMIEEYQLEISNLEKESISSKEILHKLISEKDEYIKLQKQKLLIIEEKLKWQEQISMDLNDIQNRKKYVQNSLENLKNESDTKTELQEEQLKKQDIIKIELADLETQISEMQSNIDEMQKNKKSVHENQETLLNQISNLRIELSGIENRLNSIVGEKKRIQELKDNYQFQKEENVRESKVIMQETAQCEKELNECGLNIQLNRIELDEILLEYENTINELKKSERQFDEIIKRQKTVEEAKLIKLQEKYKLENRIERVDVISQSVVIRIQEEYQLTIDEARSYFSLELNSSKEHIIYLKEQMQALGNVNIDSIEDYRVLHERYTVYEEQIADLNKSIEALEKIIYDLEKDMAKEFKHNFEHINETFGKVFSQLFGGGEGRLVLSNPSDVLNSEIEIIAQPAGKKLRSTSVMSGGEKSLMAIAILFSILMTKPAPFCILDEIDAALDDSNIARFNIFLKQMADGIQFITITHRRGTMETSDYIYGVTMQDKGVSKVVSLKFEEATDFIEQ